MLVDLVQEVHDPFQDLADPEFQRKRTMSRSPQRLISTVRTLALAGVLLALPAGLAQAQLIETRVGGFTFGTPYSRYYIPYSRYYVPYVATSPSAVPGAVSVVPDYYLRGYRGVLPSYVSLRYPVAPVYTPSYVRLRLRSYPLYAVADPAARDIYWSAYMLGRLGYLEDRLENQRALDYYHDLEGRPDTIEERLDELRRP